MLEKLNTYIDIVALIIVAIAMTMTGFALIAVGIFGAYEFITIMRLLYQ
jgi:nitrate reductase NapE component